MSGKALGIWMEGRDSGTVNNITELSTTAASTVGFYGVTKTAQPASATQAALTLTTATSGGFGFSTSAAFNAFSAQLENMRASLVLLGLLKGAA